MNQGTTQKPNISVAPMMDWTDRHCRYFHRLISPNAQLYTEMVTTGALIHGDWERFLRFDEAEHPVVLQLGGSDAQDLAFCAEAGAKAGYDEINLNCGCPSDRVQSGRFGACLMREPSHVAACVEAMCKAVDIPVTIKCRIGIDHEDSFEFLDRFVGEIADKGCKTFIIHARKAWLKGLSPKENREVPPLDYERVQAVKEKYPQLCIILNGGVKDIQTIQQYLSQPSFRRKPESSGLMDEYPGFRRDDGYALDGVMIGREAYQNPWFLNEIEKQIFGNDALRSRDAVVLKMVEYAREQKKLYGTPIKSIARHMTGLFHEQRGARAWRQTLSTLPHEDGADENVLLKALEAMEGREKIAA
jgi:tRNA-dihydrouridine synthase A